MNARVIRATVSGTIDRDPAEDTANITLRGSACELPIKPHNGVAAALSEMKPGANVHLAGTRTTDSFIAERVLDKSQSRKYVGEITRVLKNGTLRVILTDGRRCTCVPSSVKARQTSAPLRPGTKVCMVGFEIEPAATSGSNHDRVFLDAFYVRKIR